jgi:hypothetical protein
MTDGGVREIEILKKLADDTKMGQMVVTVGQRDNMQQPIKNLTA